MKTEESDDSLLSGEDSGSLLSEQSDGTSNLNDVPFYTENEVAEYEILSPNQLTQHMADITQEVGQIIQVPPTYLRLLLAHFRWDKHALTEFYFEHDKARTFAEASIIDPTSLSIPDSSTSTRSQVATSEADCDICCQHFPSNQMHSLPCKHYFCIDCWRRYLKWKIMEESQSDRIHCPAFDCNILIEDETVYNMLVDPTVRKRFQKLTTNSFVQHNRSLTWCPGIDCGYAARCFGTRESRQISCNNCSESFCFACGEPWHDPVRCAQLKIWLKHLSDDSGTSNWIVANTKECPKCHAVIEKNGGCNHMTCRNADCKYEFCWLCLDRWEPHGAQWYKCNRYADSAAEQAREKQAEARSNLQRFLFYSNRYMNHWQSLRFEARLYDSVQSKMEEMQSHGSSWIDVKYFRKVVDILCSCRRTLMYTYAFAYFLKQNNHSIIFETNQCDLEMAAEHLSGLLERDLSTTSLSELKQKLQDKARYCENRRQLLLDHVHEGYEKDFWEQLDI